MLLVSERTSRLPACEKYISLSFCAAFLQWQNVWHIFVKTDKSVAYSIVALSASVIGIQVLFFI